MMHTNTPTRTHVLVSNGRPVRAITVHARSGTHAGADAASYMGMLSHSHTHKHTHATHTYTHTHTYAQTRTERERESKKKQHQIARRS